MELQDLAKLAFEAATAGGLSWQNLGVVGALVGVVALLRLVLAPRVPFFGTPEGGILLNVLAAGFGAVVVALCGGTAFTWALLGTSLLMSWKAAGGWSLLKNFWPLLMKLPFVAALFPPRGAIASGVKLAPVKADTSDSVANGP